MNMSKYTRILSWRLRNKSKLREINRRYARKHRQQINEYTRIYRQRRYSAEPWCRTFDGIRCRLRQARRGRYKQLRYVGIQMLMTREDLKSLWIRDNAALMKNPSIDRINPDGDYRLDNCRYLEMKENRG